MSLSRNSSSDEEQKKVSVESTGKPSMLVKSLTSGIGAKTPALLPAQTADDEEREFYINDLGLSMFESVDEAKDRKAQDAINAINKAKSVLLEYGHILKKNMIDEYWSGASKYSKFDDDSADALIYLVTGRHVVSRGNEQPRLGLEILSAKQRKSIPDALHEISTLNHIQLPCFIKLYHKGLTGDHLKYWHCYGNEVTKFSSLHADALYVLMMDQDLTVDEAITHIHDMSPGSNEIDNILFRSNRREFKRL